MRPVRLFALCSVALVLTAAVAVPAQAAPQTELLVGFNGPIDTLLLKLLGATILRTFPDVSVAHVSTTNPLSLIATLLSITKISYVETDDAMHVSGSSWDASSWDASSWDASSWDASSWDGSSWDASSWDASSWDASSWDASSWDASSWDADAWGPSMDPGYASQWGLGAANFPDAWTLTTGSPSTRVCVLDTGVDATHPDLKPQLWKSSKGVYGYNAMLGGTSVADDVGHGTHVAGIVAASAGNGMGTTGATRATVMNVKVMGANGGDESDLVNGLLWCARNGGRVAVLSLHIDAASPSVERAIAKAQSQGVLVIAAAGNGGRSTVAYPAAYAGVLGVGAVTPSGERAGFSDHGSGLDLLAPGYRIASTFPGGGYAIGSGTSMAAPFVAAAAVLVWTQAPTLSATQVATKLTLTARDFGPQGWDPDHGWGALDAGAAVAATGP